MTETPIRGYPSEASMTLPFNTVIFSCADSKKTERNILRTRKISLFISSDLESAKILNIFPKSAAAGTKKA
jgi:hypothetical protein